MPEAKTCIRGTLRYDGFPQFIQVLVNLGFLVLEDKDYLKQAIPWKEATKQLIGASSSSEADLIAAVAAKANFKNDAEREQLLSGLKWLGIFSDKNITPRGTPLDTLCATLEEKMNFEEGERDMIFLQHKFEVENKDGSHDTITSTLTEYGAPTGSGGYSAMAKLVGIPCGVAVLQVLNGTLSEKGILAPMTPKINNPLMKELKDVYGIECIERKL